MNHLRVYFLNVNPAQFIALGFSNSPSRLFLERETEKPEQLINGQQAVYLDFDPLFGRELPVPIERLISQLGCRTRFTTRVVLPAYRKPGLYRSRSASLDLPYSPNQHVTFLAEAENLEDLLKLVSFFKQGLLRPELEYGEQIDAPAKTWQRLLHEAWTLLRLKVADLRWRMDNYASSR